MGLHILALTVHMVTHTYTVPPRITSGLQRTSANLDQPVSLTCRAEGTLPLQWAWQKDGGVLQPSQVGVAYTTSGAESTLTISSVRESDGGVYQCVATQPATGRQAASNDYLSPIGKVVNIILAANYISHMHLPIIANN